MKGIDFTEGKSILGDGSYKNPGWKIAISRIHEEEMMVASCSCGGKIILQVSQISEEQEEHKCSECVTILTTKLEKQGVGGTRKGKG